MICFVNKVLFKKNINKKDSQLLKTTMKLFLVNNKKSVKMGSELNQIISITNSYLQKNLITRTTNFKINHLVAKLFSKSNKKEKQKQFKPKDRSEQIEYIEEDVIPKYNEKEFAQIRNSNENSITLMEIKPDLYTKLILLKISGIISFITGLVNIYIKETYNVFNDSEILFTITNSFLLFFGLSTFVLPRHIVILLTYLPKTNQLVFSKLNTFCIRYDSVNEPNNLYRVKYRFSPLIFLKDKKSEYFSMTGIGKWYDDRLFNTLLPPKKILKQKETLLKSKIGAREVLISSFKKYLMFASVFVLMNFLRKKNEDNSSHIAKEL